MEKRSPDNGSPVAQVRIARPTDRLSEVVGFYRDALGLEQIASFEGHAGYEGVMLALPGRRDHLEFTHHESGSPCPAPTKDNLLVFYIENDGTFREMAARLERHGHEPVPLLGGAGVDLRGPGRLAGGIDARRQHLGCVRPIERPLFLPGSTPQMRPLTLLLRG